MAEKDGAQNKWQGLLKRKQEEVIEALGKGIDKAIAPHVPMPRNYNPETDSYDMEYMEDGAFAQPRPPKRAIRGLGKPTKEPDA